MRYKTLIFMYSIARIITGLILIIHGAHNALNFSSYMNRVEIYFTKLDYFNTAFLYQTAPLVPFEEFTLGLFIAMGFFTRKVLWAATLLYTFLVLFMLDAEAYNLIAFHVVLISIFLILDFSNKYDKHSIFRLFTMPV